MTLKEQFFQDLETFKRIPPQKRLSHLLDYYKLPLIAIIGAFIMVFGMIHIITSKETSRLNGFILNVSDISKASSIADSFCEYAAFTDTKSTVTFTTDLVYSPGQTSPNSNARTLQAIALRGYTEELDFMIGDLPSLTELAYMGFCGDLSEEMTAEQRAQYKDSFLYIDRALISETDSVSVIDPFMIPNCRNPEAMKDPIPVFIDVSQSSTLKSLYSTCSAPLVISIFPRAQHLDYISPLLDYLME